MEIQRFDQVEAVPMETGGGVNLQAPIRSFAVISWRRNARHFEGSCEFSAVVSHKDSMCTKLLIELKIPIFSSLGGTTG